MLSTLLSARHDVESPSTNRPELTLLSHLIQIMLNTRVLFLEMLQSQKRQQLLTQAVQQAMSGNTPSLHLEVSHPTTLSIMFQVNLK